MPASISAILQPRSVAVLGASRSRRSVGGELFHNLLKCGFNGPVYPVNPSADYVQSVRAWRSVRGLPGPVDLAIIAVPAEHAVAALEDCGRAGVGAAVVVTAGFKEIGGAGAEREAALVRIAREHDMRVVGPNCLGVLNTHPSVSLNATFAEAFPEPGPVAFLSQSGALGVAVLDRATRLGIGMSSFVSIGNRCDVSGNDLIEYWGQDPDTRVMLLYLESLGNPRHFTRLARNIGRTKPIIALKSGRTVAGSRAAASHTGALAGTDMAVDALFAQAGVIRVSTIEELFDTGMLLATQPLPNGRRVAILTNAGGPGILAADACEQYGLELTELSADTRAALARFLPPEASLKNPVDMIASAGAESYRRAVETLLHDPAVDLLLVIFVPPLMTAAPDVARAIAEGAAGAGKPVASCFMGAHGFRTGLGGEGSSAERIPSYAFPESAAQALSRAATYARWRGFADSPVPGVSLAAPPAAPSRHDQSESGWLSPGETARLLDAYGIRTPRSGVARDADEAASIAAKLGFPVVMKLIARDIVHKSDVGGVVLDRRSEDETRRAFTELCERAKQLGAELDGVLIQEYVKEGIEAVVGVTNDPNFGPLLMFGLGGVYVELLGDVAFRLHPVSEHDVDSMIANVHASKLLEGYRGAPPGDLEALRELLARVNRMVSDHEGLEEMDLNPVKILPPGRGVVVVDARIRWQSRVG
ncbi:MAG: acetate--CoA ligase family protein [Sorangiineae bacterium]|nr:acetate--CoA ligase family protein [Polyangiaceae bacterium]MEB2323240.1 acetate--CoA ligase family protein [Sorangiineae bacterium]